MNEPQKCSGWLIRRLLICAALLFAAGCATEVPIGNHGVPSAKVVRLKGSARYRTGSMAWQGLKVGDFVKPGTIMETAGKSRIDLVLCTEEVSYHSNAEQSLVRVWENSRLSIDKLIVQETGVDLVTEARLDLQAGHISGKARKMSAAYIYEVKIPNAVASIRGAFYDIDAEGAVNVHNEPEISGAKGAEKFWGKDGVQPKYEIKVQGKVRDGGLHGFKAAAGNGNLTQEVDL
jgi:hypothetical protein